MFTFYINIITYVILQAGFTFIILLLKFIHVLDIVVQLPSCLILCNPMSCSMPGFPVLHYLPVCSNSCPLSQWCHPTILSSVTPFSSISQSFPVSGSFLMSQLFASGGQSIRASASASVLPTNTQGWFPLGLTGGSLCSSSDSQETSSSAQFKSINSSALRLLCGPTLTSIHDHWKTHGFD